MSDPAGRSARIRAKADALARQLGGCTKREIEMLTRYYVDGAPEGEILAAFGASQEEFARLRARLRASLTTQLAARRPLAKAAAG